MPLSTEDLYDKTLEVAKEVPDDFLEIGKYLRRLQERDPDLFKKAVDKTGIESRTAYYWVELNKTFGSLKVSRPRLKKLGWTKLQLISPSITEANAEDMISMAENNTAAQIKVLLKGESRNNTSHCMTLYFSPEQYAELETILLANGGTRSGRGILDKEKALLKALGYEGKKPKPKH